MTSSTITTSTMTFSTMTPGNMTSGNMTSRQALTAAAVRNRSIVGFIALAACCLLAISGAVPAGATLYQLHPDVVYGHKMGMALTYDVIEPAHPNGAGVLFMVSGGWISNWFDPEAALSRSAAFSGLVEEGFTLFLVRHGSSPLFKVPDAVIDVRQALAHIRTNARQWSVDPERLGAFGGSAGGHLSLMLGEASESVIGTKGDANGARVAAVVAYFPPVDLQTMVGPNDRFPALDFDPELADDISPLLFVSTDDPPTLLIHGDKDTLVPMSNSERIRDAFVTKGVTHQLVVIEGAGHGFTGEAEKQASTLMIQWFVEHLGTASADQVSGDKTSTSSGD